MEKKIIQVNESEYNSILRQVVAVIENSKATIAKNINIGINTTHWNIGKLLHDKKLESKHGSGVVNRLSVDLKQMYPEMGVSPRNLWDMKKFYERFKESDEKLRHAVAVLPWWNTLKLMSKFGDNDEAIMYYALDLKIGEFRPEYAGKMNYYLSLLDRLERREDENRSIGIILCAEKDNLEVELALEDMGKPIGVADYQLIIPKEELKKVISDEMKSYEKDKQLEQEEE